MTQKLANLASFEAKHGTLLNLKTILVSKNGMTAPMFNKNFDELLLDLSSDEFKNQPLNDLSLNHQKIL